MSRFASTILVAFVVLVFGSLLFLSVGILWECGFYNQMVYGNRIFWFWMSGGCAP